MNKVEELIFLEPNLFCQRQKLVWLEVCIFKSGNLLSKCIALILKEKPNLSHQCIKEWISPNLNVNCGFYIFRGHI